MFRMTRLASAMAAASLTAIPAYAQTSNELEPVIVTATRTAFMDAEAPYSSEVYYAKDIKESGASNLYDFFSKRTSLVTFPNAGNRSAQLLDMRGFGLTEGYANIVITIDGRRLNNIDSVPQHLLSIPLNSIERIEITKGSGSVRFGDGANAGTIQIHTRDTDETTVSASVGNNESHELSLSTGQSFGNHQLSFYGQDLSDQRAMDPDISGRTDKSDLTSGSLALRSVFGADLSSELSFGKSKTETIYPFALTQNEFKTNPNQFGTGGKNNCSDDNWVTSRNCAYNQQKIDNEWINASITKKTSNDLALTLQGSISEKRQETVIFESDPVIADYTDLTLQLETTKIIGDNELITGVSFKNSERDLKFDTIDKDSIGLFALVNHQVGDSIISTGARYERADYSASPKAGSMNWVSRSTDLDEVGFEAGVNTRLNSTTTIHANFNRGFQTPNIDYYIPCNVAGQSGFGQECGLRDQNIFDLKAMKSDTYTLGLTRINQTQKQKLDIFYVDLKNEFAYDGWAGDIGTNFNIDKSHKYGIEAQHQQKIGSAFNLNLNYAWTKAIIDEESDAPSYDGSELPGVSRHNLSATIDIKPTSSQLISLTHNYRSSAFSAEDFSNNQAQRQKAFTKTDLKFTQDFDGFEGYILVENIFDQKNAFWVRDDALYPTDFERNWTVGVSASF
jgi:iron complex outermembrane receptor protein